MQTQHVDEMLRAAERRARLKRKKQLRRELHELERRLRECGDGDDLWLDDESELTR